MKCSERLCFPVLLLTTIVAAYFKVYRTQGDLVNDNMTRFCRDRGNLSVSDNPTGRQFRRGRGDLQPSPFFYGFWRIGFVGLRRKFYLCAFGWSVLIINGCVGSWLHFASQKLRSTSHFLPTSSHGIPAALPYFLQHQYKLPPRRKTTKRKIHDSAFSVV